MKNAALLVLSVVGVAVEGIFLFAVLVGGAGLVVEPDWCKSRLFCLKVANPGVPAIAALFAAAAAAIA